VWLFFVVLFARVSENKASQQESKGDLGCRKHGECVMTSKGEI
jgi:hypothetical protein